LHRKRSQRLGGAGETKRFSMLRAQVSGTHAGARLVSTKLVDFTPSARNARGTAFAFGHDEWALGPPEMKVNMLPLALSLALLVGVSLGLLGGGGSILTVPILRYALGMEGHAAIATSLLVVGTTSLAAMIAHARRGCVQWRTGFLFGGAGTLGAFLAGRVAHRLPASLMLLAFGALMFATALAMLRPQRTVHERDGQRPSELPISKILGAGLIFGSVTGLLGAGGGFLVVPALALLGRLPIANAIGTSLLVIALNSFAGFAGYYGHVAIDRPLAFGICAAAVVGSFGGALLASRLSAKILRLGFGWFVIAMAFFILAQEVPLLLGLRANLALASSASVLATAFIAFSRWMLRGRRPGRGSAERSRETASAVRSIHPPFEREPS
jgi:uncharacterized membrane protein YfcA